MIPTAIITFLRRNFINPKTVSTLPSPAQRIQLFLYNTLRNAAAHFYMWLLSSHTTGHQHNIRTQRNIVIYILIFYINMQILANMAHI